MCEYQPLAFFVTPLPHPRCQHRKTHVIWFRTWSYYLLEYIFTLCSSLHMQHYIKNTNILCLHPLSHTHTHTHIHTCIVLYLISRINLQLCTGAQFVFPLTWRCRAATTAFVWQFFWLSLEMTDAEHVRTSSNHSIFHVEEILIYDLIQLHHTAHAKHYDN